MSPTQESVFSILESIATRHDTYKSLRSDRRYQAWLKHVSNKSKTNTFFRNFYLEYELEKLTSKQNEVMYF